MPVIIVNSPFALRLSPKYPRRDFPVGEHQVSQEELGHWFMGACLANGRADLKEDADEEHPGGAAAGASAPEPAADEAPASVSAPETPAPEAKPASSGKSRKRDSQ